MKKTEYVNFFLVCLHFYNKTSKILGFFSSFFTVVRIGKWDFFPVFVEITSFKLIRTDLKPQFN